MKAVIMAGGKAKRLEMDIEKPLIIIDGKSILERIVYVLNNAGINDIFIAVTDLKSQTKNKAEELHLKIIQTPGNGYVEDIHYLMKKFNEFLSINADLPYLNSNLIKDVLTKYHELNRPISVVVPIKVYENMGFTPSTIFNGFIPIGVNIVTIGEDYFFVTKGRESININTKEELERIIK